MLTETTLYHEIHEQPVVVEQLLAQEQKTLRDLATAIRARGITHIIIAARGTSANASRYAGYVFGAVAGMTVAWAMPSLSSVYRQPPRMKDALVIGISQSGKSPDIVSVVAEARRQGALTAVITNTPDSPLANEADVVIHLHAREEKAVAATKTYTTQLAAIALLGAYLSEDVSLVEEVCRIPAAIHATLGMDAQVGEVAPRFRYMERCVVVGRGYNYATAFEMALKMQELTYTITEPYSSAEFMHGPLAMVEEGFPIVVVAPSGVMTPELQGLMTTLRDLRGEVLTISDDPDTLALGHVPLHLPCRVAEWLSPLTAIVPGQLFAMHLAHARHYNVDAPRAIQKITETV